MYSGTEKLNKFATENNGIVRIYYVSIMCMYISIIYIFMIYMHT